jgi:hypothetical protein
MGYTVDTLVEALRDEPETMWVRLVAHWLTAGELSPVPAAPAGSMVADALVAAAVAMRARTLGESAPGWTSDQTRVLAEQWHPGPDAMFAWSLEHAPAEFRDRGLIVEGDSLQSV